MVRSFVIILLILLGISAAEASSCCGQSPASFTVLSLHQKLNLSVGYSSIHAQGRVYSDSDKFFIWEDRKKRNIQSTKLSLAGSLSERHQLAISSSYLNAHYQDPFEEGRSQNFSDTLLSYTYEVLPEYTYSPWKPVIYLSSFINIPTGHSIYDDSQLSEGSDVTGHNQWGAGFGLTLRKVFFPITLVLQGKFLRLFDKRFSKTHVSDFNDSSLAFLTTYSLGLWDLSTTGGFTWTHLSGRTINSSQLQSESSEVTTTILSLQKPLNDSFSVTLAYSDQTLLGKQRNTILNKTYTFNLNYNYF